MTETNRIEYKQELTDDLELGALLLSEKREVSVIGINLAA